MTRERFEKLMADDAIFLTREEFAAGWHFCPSWDGLLVGPGTDELEACECPPFDPESAPGRGVPKGA